MSRIGLIADSCCDLTAELREKIAPASAPLIIEIIGEATYVDDGTIDTSVLVEHMHTCKNGCRSACPSPETFRTLMMEHDECFVVTISSKLSGTHNSAMLAKAMVLEKYPEKRIHVFDSGSACAGETLLLLSLYDLIEAGMTFDSIIEEMNKRISAMRTLFVLEDLGNLFKGGRLHKIAGYIVSRLALCPIMSDDGQGNIKLASPAIGMRHSLHKLVDMVATATEGLKEHSVRLVMCFCNCVDRANNVKKSILKRCPAIEDVIVVPTAGLSTMYANDGGVVIAF